MKILCKICQKRTDIFNSSKCEKCSAMVCLECIAKHDYPYILAYQRLFDDLSLLDSGINLKSCKCGKAFKLI